MNLSLSRTVVSQILFIASFMFLAYSAIAQSSESLLSKTWDDYDTTSAIACYDQRKKVFATSMDSALMFFEKGTDIQCIKTCL